MKSELERRKMEMDFRYKMVKSYQENSNDPFVKNFNTEEMYEIVYRPMLSLMQEYYDKTPWEEMKNKYNKEIEKYFELERRRRN